jgi:hypothetical protein
MAPSPYYSPSPPQTAYAQPRQSADGPEKKYGPPQRFRRRKGRYDILSLPKIISGHIDDAARIRLLELRGLATYCVLFFIHLKSRKVDIAGINVIGGLNSPTHATASGPRERA